MRCSLVFQIMVFAFLSGLVQASPTLEVIEENDTRWQYSGYWRNSTQGQYGSGGAYMVGKATLDGTLNKGEAYLDLTAFAQSAPVSLELCYVQHSARYRSTQVVASVHYSESSKHPVQFSQVGSVNTQACYSLGSHTGVVGLSVSNHTADGQWVSLDQVRVQGAQTPPPTEPKFNSQYTKADIVPVLPLGTTLARDTIIRSRDLGVEALTMESNYGLAIATLDDLDQNGIPELLVTGKHKSDNHTQGHFFILYLDASGAVSRVQSVDELMLKDSGFAAGFDARYLNRVGDFDGNGTTDVVMAENGTTMNPSGRFRVLLLDRKLENEQLSYTVLRSIEYSNAAGNLPVVLTSNATFGVSPYPIGDIDQNGTLDFLTLAVDTDGDLRRSMGRSQAENLYMALKIGNNGDVLSINHLFSPFGGAPIIAGYMNNDNLPDMVGPYVDSKALTFHIAQGNYTSFASFTTHPITVNGGKPFRLVRIIPVGDANGDGHVDIVLAGSEEGQGSSHKVRGLLLLDEHYQPLGDLIPLVKADEYPDFWRAIHSAQSTFADMDGDGDLDMVMGHIHDPDGPSLHIRYYE
ncbi:hypothetical protein CWB99_10570 [Pseudoalteromonas rubra]|uniref:VCBS repeat-containing protein n=1 Tax=Pseudoalteromonas rubra TaxID=43658 RepID=A0A5S3WNZ4_9GAMM|nr:hypothetical protein [Pseudoalteromonas rubra]TMP27985.1 hypothetical protein CWC00_22540 [Pseudoalteromonas rubra]TMP28820.1 hypothetical protein CWB99_10570 [Pseudoalteromonas rubra]